MADRNEARRSTGSSGKELLMAWPRSRSLAQLLDGRRDVLALRFQVLALEVLHRHPGRLTIVLGRLDGVSDLGQGRPDLVRAHRLRQQRGQEGVFLGALG